MLSSFEVDLKNCKYPEKIKGADCLGYQSVAVLNLLVFFVVGMSYPEVQASESDHLTGLKSWRSYMTYKKGHLCDER